MGIFHTWRTRLLEHFYTEQLNAVFSWLRNERTVKYGAVYVHLPTLRFCVDYDRSPAPDSAPIGILICTKETRGIAFHEKAIVPNDWHKTFSSPFFEIWEDTSLHQSEALPIRFGLSEKEQVLLHNFAKEHLFTVLHLSNTTMTPLESLPKRLWDYTDVDVAFWVNGSLRGSIVYTDTPCVLGIQKSVSLASVDTRFKPLTPDDIPNTQIEISCISSLRIPLSEQEISKDLIYAEKTYRTEVLGKPGWYLPTVFNCRPFRNLTELRHSLLIEKVGVSPKTPRVTLTVSETATSLSSCTKSQKPRNLTGPLVVSDSLEKIDLTHIQESAIGYLAAIQESDGNIPAVVSPFLGHIQTFDPIRLPHCAWALLEYGATNDHDLSRETGLRAYTFLKGLMGRPQYLSHLNVYQRLLGLLYLYNAASVLEEAGTMDHIAGIIQTHAHTLPDEPICRLQYIQFALRHESLIDKATEEIDSLLKAFESKDHNSEEISLASYADLLLCLHKLSNIHSCVQYQEKLKSLIEWYKKHQLEDGAFPDTTLSSYSYTRGTLKILEALSSVIALNKLDYSSLPWLARMQFTNESTFCVQPAWQEKIIGGLRHDAHNATCWIDAAGHLLLIKE